MANGNAGNGVLEEQVRQRIENLSYLPTIASVAIKFIELGKNPEAEPAEYAKVISSDTSLSTKLLALANSSWFGVRNKVTKPNLAVNLLGLGTVRTLAISYCLTGLHNDLKLGADESRMFWSSALCKAVAAKQYAKHFSDKLAEEAFAAGLFQDFALTVMYATAKEMVLPLMGDPTIDWKQRLEREREIFRLDHAEIGRMVAQKLELPDVFVDGVAFHHNYESLVEFLESKVMADAIYAAGLFPHTLDVWNRADAEELRKFVVDQSTAAGKPRTMEHFMEETQKEFEQLYAFFESGSSSPRKITEMLEVATREAADTTTRLVGSVQALLQERACLAGAGGPGVNPMPEERKPSEERDLVTGTLNRQGLLGRATQALTRAYRNATPVSVALFDVDDLERLNARHGPHYGEAALKNLAGMIAEAVRAEDLVGRVKGTQIAFVTFGRTHEEMSHLLQAIVARFTGQPLNKGKAPVKATASVGLAYVPAGKAGGPLETLIGAAQKLLEVAQKLGGNRLSTGPKSAAVAA